MTNNTLSEEKIETALDNDAIQLGVLFANIPGNPIEHFKIASEVYELGMKAGFCKRIEELEQEIEAIKEENELFKKALHVAATCSDWTMTASYEDSELVGKALEKLIKAESEAG